MRRDVSGDHTFLGSPNIVIAGRIPFKSWTFVIHGRDPLKLWSSIQGILQFVSTRIQKWPTKEIMARFGLWYK